MRFKNKQTKIGDVRVVVKFLLLPTEIDNQTRWLEIAKIKQRAYLFYGKFKWHDIEFVNK